MEVKSTGKEVWILFYQWLPDEDSHTYAVYDSQEALAFDFGQAYRSLALYDSLNIEEIERAKIELLTKDATTNRELGLYMWVENMKVYGFREED